MVNNNSERIGMEQKSIYMYILQSLLHVTKGPRPLYIGTWNYGVLMVNCALFNSNTSLYIRGKKLFQKRKRKREVRSSN